MIAYRVFVVDDEAVARNGIALALSDEYDVQAFENAEDALDALPRQRPDLVLLDIGLPGMSGIEALKQIKRTAPDTLVVMITAYEDLTTVVDAMKSGAYDYIVKPVHVDALTVTIDNALGSIRLRKEIQVLQEQRLQEKIPCFIGESKSIQSVMEFVDLVAKSPDTPVLVCGETGTGKELVASAIHYKSPNFKGPFVTVNCAAIPQDLIESELFGYERGAFSGAREQGKRGLVEEAANGTLFLDEIGDLSLAAQAKLLRFLEEGEYYRVGGTQKQRVQTRVVSATNRDLEELTRLERFREDLYYRLAVIRVEIPRLTSRSDDILPIAAHFMFEYSRKFGKQFTAISPEAQQCLLSHDWKGNIRELRNVIERSVLTGDGPALLPDHIGFAVDRVAPGAASPPADASATHALVPELPETGVDLQAVLKSIERHYMNLALERAQGNESQAARLLQLNYYTFRHRRKKLLDS